ncbi:hypothetical protein HDU87_008163 [Geranomyces variabilis]|uniref:U3 small nucleolar RNA-associated protein 25 n=1 Tax=Geranomyces variabilis TaxID=109894 RepID=A0AAD5XJZ8_9FUNG|nr:hypothetical protein HDU87_008163 [Geranomyces variabilis]
MPKRLSQTRTTGEWDAPSAYSKLVKSLKRSRKVTSVSRLAAAPQRLPEPANPRKRAKKTHGLPAEELRSDEASSGNDEDPGRDDGLDPVDDNDQSKDDAQEEADIAAAAAEDESDDDEQEGGKGASLWTRHFGDLASESLAFLGAAADANEWETRSSVDPELQTVLRYTLKASGHAAVPPPSSTPPNTLRAANIKQRLHEPWLKTNAALFNRYPNGAGNPTPYTSLQAPLLSHLLSFHDVLFARQTHQNTPEIRNAYALHALNHVFQTRDRVLKNTAKLRADNAPPDLELRDQGFTRAKVLILAPFKNAGMEIVQTLMALSATKQQDNKKRFFQEFGTDPLDDLTPGFDSKKPEDHKQIFKGNIDDCFRVGVKFSRTQLKLYADFYSSDIIVASPLGLRMVLGAEGEKKRDFDFLSAIEMVVMDSADIFLMQNWDHVVHIFDHLNRIPKDPHGCDFSRVRSYYLDGRARNVRQTIAFSRFLAPELNALFHAHCKNVAGKVKIRDTTLPGSIADVAAHVPQIFHRVPTATAAEAADARFEYFVANILPTLRTSSAVQQKRTLVFVPSYFDFVRVRNYLDEHNYDAVELCEYTTKREVSRARTDFFNGNASYALYTERFHFFRRYHIRGMRHIVFYALPEYGEYYAEMVNMLEEGKTGEAVSCTVLYTKYDRLRLERVVGTKRVARMCEGEKDAFMFT